MRLEKPSCWTGKIRHWIDIGGIGRLRIRSLERTGRPSIGRVLSGIPVATGTRLVISREQNRRLRRPFPVHTSVSLMTPMSLAVSRAHRSPNIISEDRWRPVCVRARYRFGQPRGFGRFSHCPFDGMKPTPSGRVTRTCRTLSLRVNLCAITRTPFRKFTYYNAYRARVHMCRVGSYLLCPRGLASSAASDRAHIMCVHGWTELARNNLLSPLRTNVAPPQRVLTLQVCYRFSVHRVLEIAYDTAVWSRSHVILRAGRYNVCYSCRKKTKRLYAYDDVFVGKNVAKNEKHTTKA